MSSSPLPEIAGRSQHNVWQWLFPLLAAASFVLVGLAFAKFLPLLIAAGFVALGGWAILRWPDLATLAVVGLIYSNLPVVVVQVHGAPGIVPVAVLAMLGWPLFYRIVIQGEAIRFYAAWPFMCCYLVVMVIGTLLARSPEIAGESLSAFLMEGVALYLIFINVVRTRRMLHSTLWVLALAGMLMGAGPLLQLALGDATNDIGGLARPDANAPEADPHEIVEVGTSRAAGTIGEQNRYAQFMLMLVPIGLALVRLETSTWWRMVAIAATLLALLGAAMAFSRGAAVGVVMAVGIAAYLKLLDRKQLKLVVLAGALALLLMPHYLTRLASLGSILTSATSGQVGNHSDGAVRGRLTEMAAAAMAFRDHPIVGVGPGMFIHYSKDYGQIIGLRSLADEREAHCLPLGIAAENGILGLFAFCGMLAAVGLRLRRARQAALDRNDTLGVQIATALLLVGIVFLTTGLFLHMAYIRYFWMTLAIADAAGQIVLHGDQGADALPQLKSEAAASASE